MLAAPPVSVAQEPPTQFDIRVVQRSRYESLNDQFRPGLSSSDQALAFRTFRVNVQAGSPAVRFLGELMDSEDRVK